MIAKASSVSHGYNAINYAMTKNDAKYINSNHLPVDEVSAMLGNYDTDGVWEAMQDRKNSKIGKTHHNIKNDVIRIEIAPSVEEAATLKTDEDWNNLLQQWMVEMEKVANKKDKKGKPKSLDFKNSQWVAMCHFDSGKPHIHLIVNRVREDGTVNKDCNIGLNATKAANAVNDQRGWKQSAEIHNEKTRKIYNDAMDCLRVMPKFDWMEYKRLMEEKGYTLSMRRDSEGKVVSYRVDDGNSSYKASEIGPGKNLTAAHIFSTWGKLHQSLSPAVATVTNEHEATEDMVTCEYTNDYGYSSSLSIPKVLSDILHDEVVVPDEENSDEDLDWNEEWDGELADRETVIEQAIKAFVSLAIPSSNGVTSGGGGGVQGELSRWDGLPAERKDDYIYWARQAAQIASSACEPKKREKSRVNRR